MTAFTVPAGAGTGAGVGAGGTAGAGGAVATAPGAPTLLANRPSKASRTSASAGGVAGTTPTTAAVGSSGAADMPKTMFERVKHMAQEYGPTALALYVTGWVVPAAGFYYTFLAYHNFGHNPVSILEFFHVKDYVFDLFKLDADAKLEEWQVSAVYAYLGAELLEAVRLPAVLWLAPKVKRALSRSPPPPQAHK